jgi:hypothetical protein
MSSLDHLVGPADDRLCQLDGLPVLLLGHGLGEAGIPGLECIAREHHGVLHGLRDMQAVLPEACDEILKVMYIAKGLSTMKIHRFEGFLRCLLGMEAEIFIKQPMGKGARANARSPRARASHSWGEPGIGLSWGTIELSSFPERRTQYQRGIVSVVVDVALGCYYDVLSEAKPFQAGIDGLCSPPSMNSIRHDNEEVEVTIRSHPPSCRRPE